MFRHSTPRFRAGRRAAAPRRTKRLMLVSTLALMLLPAGCTGKTDLYSRQERFLPASSLMPQEPSQRAELIFAQLKRNEADAELFTASNLKLMKANLEQSFASFNVQRLWRSYGLLLQDQGGRTVVPLTAEDEVALTNIYQLTRFGFHNSQELISLHNSARFAQRFNLWCGQAQNSLPMDPAMRELYRLLAQTIVRSGVITGIKALRKIDSEIFDNMRDLLGINDSDRAIHSLNRFLLAA